MDTHPQRKKTTAMITTPHAIVRMGGEGDFPKGIVEEPREVITDKKEEDCSAHRQGVDPRQGSGGVFGETTSLGWKCVNDQNEKAEKAQDDQNCLNLS